jgi:hypothetical protein
MTDKTTNHHPDKVIWKPLPILKGGVWVGMVTEVLDREGIANVVQTDFAAGGVGVITGTEPLGNPWRIQVPEDDYARALEIYESLMGDENKNEG